VVALNDWDGEGCSASCRRERHLGRCPRVCCPYGGMLIGGLFKQGVDKVVEDCVQRLCRTDDGSKRLSGVRF
jgi:hypothetical protein